MYGPAPKPIFLEIEDSDDEDEGLPICNMHTLEGHTAPVLNMCFSKSGGYLLTCSQDKSVKLWNPMKGNTLIKTFTGAHNYEINDICAISDSSRFFTVGGDKIAFLHDVASGEVVRKFVAHERKISACCVYNDNVLLTAGHDKTVRAWDLRQSEMKKPKPAQTMDDAKDACIQVLTVDKEIIVGSVDGCMYRYDVRMGCMFTDHFDAPLGSVTVSNDGNCLLISTLDDTIRLMEKDQSEDLCTYKGHKNSRFKLGSTLNPGDEYVCSGSEDGTLFFWDIVSGDKIHSMPKAHEGAIFACKFSPNKQKTMLCTSGEDGKVHVWTPGF